MTSENTSGSLRRTPHEQGGSSSRRTFLLVHGGTYTSRCWDLLAPLLDGDVVAVDLPGRGRRPADIGSMTVADNVAAVLEELGDKREVILVGHSMGGITVAEVLNRVSDQIREVVLLSCIIPSHGRTGMDAIDPEVRDLILGIAVDGAYKLDDADPLRHLMGNDVSERDMPLVLDVVDESLKILQDPVDVRGLSTFGSVTYVRLTNDLCLSPRQQDKGIAALGSPDVVEIDSGHMVMISQPKQVAGILNEIAAR